MAIISAYRLMEYLTDPAIILRVQDAAGQLLFMADLPIIAQLAKAGQVCGSAKGRRVRHLELLVPLSEIAPTGRHIERPGNLNAQTNIGAYKQSLTDANWCWSLCACRALDGAIDTAAV